MRIRCSIRSKVGEAPPVVKTGPVDDVAVGAHVGLREGGGEILHVLPMGGRGAALEQAGTAEQPGARLDAADGARRLGDAADAAEQARGAAWSRVPKPPIDHQHVGPRRPGRSGR